MLGAMMVRLVPFSQSVGGIVGMDPVRLSKYVLTELAKTIN
jgi:hypothetical protein